MSSPRSVQELTRVSVQDSEMDLQLNQYKNLNLIYFIQHQGYKNKMNFLLAFLRNVFSLKYLFHTNSRATTEAHIFLF